MTSDEQVGAELYELVERLIPINRSITGQGVRETLTILSGQLPLGMVEVPSGTPVFDWRVPSEWNVKEAWLAGPDQQRVVDIADHPLHLMGYSTPIRTRMTLEELRPHLVSMPDRPDWIPYRTSYYQDAWAFCLPDRLLSELPDGIYDVCIDSSLDEDGSLTYGELFLPGEEDAEVLVSTHVCHPGMANDNATGMAVAVALAQRLRAAQHRLSYRFLFVPGTIGAITWLARNETSVARISHGLVITGLGDSSALTYKRSRRETAVIDRVVPLVLTERGAAHRILPFSPYGYDERQFCSPGFDLPVGRLGRAQHGEYPEYHTSADDLTFVSPEALAESLATLLEVFAVLEKDRRYLNRYPKCEPQLGKRGLYRSIGATIDRAAMEMSLLWVLNLSDGHHSLLDIAVRSGLRFGQVSAAADLLVEAELLAAL